MASKTNPKAKPKSPTKAPESLTAIFFTKAGAILTRKIDQTHKTLIVPMNNGDNRIFVKGGELVSPFVSVSFRYVNTVKASGFTLAIYEEFRTREFDPTEMTEVKPRSLEVDFAQMNPKVK